MCGEKVLPLPFSCRTRRSPPRVRGKGLQQLPSRRAARITPACAGKRILLCVNSCSHADHPRVCGEKDLVVRELMLARGSPPRVRGKVLILVNFILDSRITPACAGKRWNIFRSGSERKDHPRVCGEKKSRMHGMNRVKGSPPRVRGKEYLVTVLPNIQRITPACAGKSPELRMISSGAWDHPRVCGEKVPSDKGKTTTKGSPPRVRGKEHYSDDALRKNRITPACAGKSRTQQRCSMSLKDHPRVCGEKAGGTAEGSVHQGSPPRVRGKGRSARPQPRHRRITPACAGKRPFIIENPMRT